MRRLLVLPAAGVICALEIYRRGFAAPLLFGARLWVAALDPRPLPTTEPELVG